MPDWLQVTVWTVVTAVLMFLSIIIFMALLTFAERRVIGSMQARIGPNRIRAFGLPFTTGWVQPFADVLKLMFKEIIIPSSANKFLFLLAPLLTAIPALATWAVMPFWPGFTVANIDAGLLYILALTSTGVYGVILAGWAANSKYAFLGAMRAAAQVVAYEIAMGFALVGVVMAAGSLNLGDIIAMQRGSIGHWFMWWLFPLFVVYFISGVAETNRAPFDVVEGESEIVAGFHVDYSGMAFALFFVAEYINMILISALTSVFFLGGWLSPFDGVSWLPAILTLPGLHWLWLKIGFFLFCFLWFRATFPRYRYDQIMRLGWKVFIPVTLVWIVVEAFLAIEKVGPWARLMGN
ncbi:MAG: NADH-quinone oxidoreductase subunit NuoH [Steroidobacteraceae bacterium]